MARRRESEALGETRRQPHARKAAGTATEGDGLQLAQGQPRSGQEGVDHRQNPLCVAAPQLLIFQRNHSVDQKRRRAGFGRGIQSQQSHGGAE